MIQNFSLNYKNEPIAHYGPFVMNTDQELLEAVEDYNSGKFGRI